MNVKLIFISVFLLLLSKVVLAHPIYLALEDAERIMDQNRELPGNCRVKLLNLVPGSFLNIVLKRGGAFGERAGIQLRERGQWFKKTEDVVTYRFLQVDRSRKCYYTDIFEKCKSTRTTILLDVDSAEHVSRIIVREDELLDDQYVKNNSMMKCSDE